MAEFGNDLPITVYSLTGFIGGLPSTLNPMMFVRSPLTGIVRFNCCPLISSPYEMLLPPPDTMPFFTESLSLWHAQLLRRKIEQRLVGIRGHFAEIRRTVGEEAERAAAVGRLICRSRYDRVMASNGIAVLQPRSADRPCRPCPARNRFSRYGSVTVLSG